MSKSGKDEKNNKLHVEITPLNWTRLTEYIDAYNGDPARVTPKIKPAHIINEALCNYFKKKVM